MKLEHLKLYQLSLELLPSFTISPFLILYHLLLLSSHFISSLPSSLLRPLSFLLSYLPSSLPPPTSFSQTPSPSHVPETPFLIPIPPPFSFTTSPLLLHPLPPSFFFTPSPPLTSCRDRLPSCRKRHNFGLPVIFTPSRRRRRLSRRPFSRLT